MKLAHVRVNRASSLIRIHQDHETIVELERASRTFELATQDKTFHLFGEYRDYAYYAANSLISLAWVYLCRTEEKDKAWATLKRVLEMHTLLVRQFDRSVNILQQSAQLLFELGEKREALKYLEQAEQLYTQWLVPITRLPRIALISEELKKTRKRLLSVG